MRAHHLAARQRLCQSRQNAIISPTARRGGGGARRLLVRTLLHFNSYATFTAFATTHAVRRPVSDRPDVVAPAFRSGTARRFARERQRCRPIAISHEPIRVKSWPREGVAMATASSERVIVGVDGSSESVAALRTAAQQARCRGARLCVVHVRSRRRDLTARVRRRRSTSSQRRADGLAVIDAALEKALGREQNAVPVSRLLTFGKPGPSLVGWAWRENDLLVVAARGGNRLRRMARRSVSRYCVAHAHGPVLIVGDHGSASSGVDLLPTPRCAPNIDATARTAS